MQRIPTIPTPRTLPRQAPTPDQPEAVGSVLLRVLEGMADNAADEHTALELRQTVADLRGAAAEKAA